MTVVVGCSCAPADRDSARSPVATAVRILLILGFHPSDGATTPISHHSIGEDGAGDICENTLI